MRKLPNLPDCIHKHAYNHFFSASMIAMFGIATAAYAARTDEMQLYFGDVHLHSNYSTDAFATGNRTVTPDMAYKFARGYPIVHPALHTKVKIDRPLDFLALTDHAINLGIDNMVIQKDRMLQATEWGRRLIESSEESEWQGFMRYRPEGGNREEMMGQVFSDKVRSAAWRGEIEAAENNYVPGEFTTLIGWEWTAMGEGVRNLHRCIISNADGDSAGNFIPLSNNDTNRPEDLWSYLEKTSSQTGIDFVSIPHNSNISGGLMFNTVDSDGLPITAQYASTRIRWEPLMEVTQTKGTSEVHPELAPTDEFAEFEIRRKLLTGTPTPADKSDYARSALLRGLEIDASVGINPYKFGMVGATDNHIGMSTVEESNFLGKIASDSKIQDHYKPERPVIFPAWEMSASGLAAVWARENTREEIFAAFKRKEVYATTGTRIRLQMFGGYSFRERDARARDIADRGYRNGVPMGGDLTTAPRGKVPTLLIHAVKDPQGANLDRIQVIKGWIDNEGKSHEYVYDVAWSGNRKPGSDGKLPPVGNTVDLNNATYSNTIGAAQLAIVWKDPDFDPEQSAFYYTRVIEIPTPRHSLFDAIALGIDVGETKHAATIQERAYSSPIWYTP